MASDLVLPMGGTARRLKAGKKRETTLVLLLLLPAAAREAAGDMGYRASAQGTQLHWSLPEVGYVPAAQPSWDLALGVAAACQLSRWHGT